MQEHSFTIGEELAGERLDVALVRLLPELTRARAQKLLENKQVLVGGRDQKANYRVKKGDLLQVFIPPVRPSEYEPEDIELNVLYEDDYLLVLDKPKGQVVHPAAGHGSGTLVNALLYHCRSLSGIGGEARPGIVHRLDKDTSGILVIAKNDHAHAALSAQFKAHSVTREYVAIVHGDVKRDKGTIVAAIGRHPRDRKKMAVVPENKGRHAVTHFQVLERFGRFTYLSLQLETGRTHQIRVHLASIGHPVAGDPVYGPRRAGLPLSGQALHARKLGFLHPADNRYLEFTSVPPAEFRSFLALLRKETGGEGLQ